MSAQAGKVLAESSTVYKVVDGSAFSHTAGLVSAGVRQLRARFKGFNRPLPCASAGARARQPHT